MTFIIQLILLSLCLTRGHSLSCITCGDDGICTDGVEQKPKECPDNTKGCMISVEKIGDAFYDMKDCFETTNELQIRGCVQITNEHGVRKLFKTRLKLFQCMTARF